MSTYNDLALWILQIIIHSLARQVHEASSQIVK
jgi:hypothetical protein